MTHRARDLFVQAHDLPPAGREAFLAQICGDHAKLHLEVKRMLADAECGDSFFGDKDGTTLVAEESKDTPAEKEGDVVGMSHHIEEAKLGRLVAPDLDLIVMKAIEKDRTHRYETANALAQDIRRFLADEQVVARPPSKLYEFQKTVRRHQFGFAATAAIILVLATGVMLTSWQAVRATAAEKRAAATAVAERAAREQAEATVRLLTEALESREPSRDGKTSLRSNSKREQQHPPFSDYPPAITPRKAPSF